MPELHKLTPSLGVLQDEGFKVALVTDGRMSGASGKVPAVIHVTPECIAGGPLAKVRTGDVIVIDAENGVLDVRVSDEELASRSPDAVDLAANRFGLGRELFNGFRLHASGAEEGAMTFMLPEEQEPAGLTGIKAGLGDRFAFAGGERNDGSIGHRRCAPCGAGDPGSGHRGGSARAVPLAQALLAGGVRVLEVTLRTPAAIARHPRHCQRRAGRDRRRRHRFARSRIRPGGRCRRPLRRQSRPDRRPDRRRRGSATAVSARSDDPVATSSAPAPRGLATR